MEWLFIFWKLFLLKFIDLKYWIKDFIFLNFKPDLIGRLRADDEVIDDAVENKYRLLGKIKLNELLQPFSVCVESPVVDQQTDKATQANTTTTTSKKFSIEYDAVLRCYAVTIRFLAGHNLYVDATKEIRIPGINVAFVAQKDIVLPHKPAEFRLDTTGRDAIPFQHKQAQCGGTKEAAKKDFGANGEDGFDGLSGQNGGHVYMQALDGRIRNLDDATCVISIDTSGGKGSKGQMGGVGQKGGAGEDTGDAKAYDFGICFFTPGFSM